MPGDIPLAQAPLEAGLAPPANVLILVDDSGSMDWELVSDGNEGLYQVGPFDYGHVFSRTSNLFLNAHSYGNGVTNDTKFGDGMAVPTKEAIAAQRAKPGGYTLFATELDNAWQMRDSDYNQLYYNPAVTYEPWPGMPNSLPNKALLMPSQLLEGTRLEGYRDAGITTNINTIDLTQAQTLDFFFPTQGDVDVDSTTPFNTPGDSNSGYRAPDVTLSVYLPFYYSGPTTKVVLTSTADVQNYANWFSYYRRRELAAKAAMSRVVNEVSGLNLGYAAFNADPNPTLSRRATAYGPTPPPTQDLTNYYNPKSPIESLTSAVRKKLLEKIYTTYAGRGKTPLLSHLKGAGKYFQCIADDLFESGFTGYDPSANTSHPACPRMAPSEPGAQCQQNISLLITDGFWNMDNYGVTRQIVELSNGVSNVGSGNEPHYDNDGDGNTAFDGGAFADQSKDGANTYLTLADIAMYFYETDLDVDATNNDVPMTAIDKAMIVDDTAYSNGLMHQHMKTHVIGFGVQDSSVPIGPHNDFLVQFDSTGKWIAPTNPSAPLDWPGGYVNSPSADKVYDLIHTAFNGRGNYYSAFNQSALTSSLRSIFSEVSAGSGAVASVSFNSETLEAGSKIYAASYNAGNASGDVKAYSISTAGEVSTTADWSASELLNSKLGDCGESDSRNILTFDANSASEVPFTYSALNALGIAGLDEPQVKWIRGSRDDESRSSADPLVCAAPNSLRDRSATSGIIGTIVHSRPLYVGRPSLTGRTSDKYPSGANAYSAFAQRYAVGGADASDRKEMVMVGTNAGLFHVFDTNGQELFAYVPNQIITGNDANAIADTTSISFSNQYYIDLPPAVEHVFFPSTSAWRTVAIGGYRAGGKGYFALDVTETNGLSSAGNAAADNTTPDSGRVLGEFTTQNLPGVLGHTYSAPLMAMLNDPLAAGKGNRWAAIFGNGYNSARGDASLVIIDVEGFKDSDWSSSNELRVITAYSEPNVATVTEKNGLSRPRGIDVDQDGTVDYAYAGDLYGNVYRFDLTDMNNLSAVKIFTAYDANSNPQPITTQPYVVPHPTIANEYIVVVTTGRWLTAADASSTAVQSVYGIADDLSSTTVLTRSNLATRTLTNLLIGGDTQRTISGNAVDWAGFDKGWYMDLSVASAGPGSVSSPAGERAIRNMLERNGYLFFTTVFPGDGGCEKISGGSLMALNPQSGLLDRPVLDFDNDGTYDLDGADPIAGAVLEDGLGDLAMLGPRLVFNKTDEHGNVTQASIGTPSNKGRSGRLGWREVQ